MYFDNYQSFVRPGASGWIVENRFASEFMGDIGWFGQVVVVQTGCVDAVERSRRSRDRYAAIGGGRDLPG